MSLFQVNLMHIFIIGPLFYLIGSNENKNPIKNYHFLQLTTIFLIFIVSHPWIKLYNNQITLRNLINASHFILYFPLILYISIYQNNANLLVFPLFKYLGLSVITIHLYLAIKKLN
jgi:hypothetical protein